MPQRAVTILGAADALRRTIGSRATPLEVAEYEAELSALRTKMDGAAFDSAWQEGQRLNMEGAIALAVRENAPR